MTTLVDRLESAGYVTRSTDPTDARAEILRRSLTAFGPASRRDIAAWSMMHVPELARGRQLVCTLRPVPGGIYNEGVKGRFTNANPLFASSDADLTVTMSSDKVGTGNGVYVFAPGRRVAGAGDYRLQIRLRADGLVGASILRTDAAGAQTVLRLHERTSRIKSACHNHRVCGRIPWRGTSPRATAAVVKPALIR